ncbi:MAG: acyltransferase family protein [Chloroflexota bacterium]
MDIFKGITIVLIVLGHAASTYTAYFYLFHVPAFFFISGFVTDLEKDPFLKFLWKRFRQLIIPYLSINLLFILFGYLVTLLGWDRVLLSSPIHTAILPSLLRDLLLRASSIDLGGATWFLIVLFTASILAKLIHSLAGRLPSSNANLRFWLLFALSILAIAFGYRLYNTHTTYPLLLDLSFNALFFFSTGILFRRYALFEKSQRLTPVLLPIALILMYYFVKVNWAPMNWPTRAFTPSPIPNVLSSLAGIYLTYLASRILLLNKYTRLTGIYIGMRTLSILVFHFFTMKLVFILFYALKIVPGSQVQQLVPPGGNTYWLPLSALSIYLALGIDYLIRKQALASFFLLGVTPSQPLGAVARSALNDVFDSGIKESLAIVIVTGIFLIIYAQQAFTGFFMGEDFAWYSIYLKASGNPLRAMFTSYGPFFRPAIIGWATLSATLLPWDAALQHFRNFAFTLVNIFLLHQILLLLVRSRAARMLGITLFVLTKIHLTVIGWIGIVDQNYTLLHALGTILFIIRYLQKNKKIDYALALIFFALTISSRDYSFIFALVVITLFLLYQFENQARFENSKSLWLQISPFLALLVVYFIARISVLGLSQISATQNPNSEYAIQLNPGLIFRNSVVFLGNLFNLSLSQFFPAYKGIIQMRMGYGDLSTLFTDSASVNIAYQAIVLSGGLILLGITTYLLIKQRKWALFGLVWGIVMIAPTLVIGINVAYYAYESIAALAILLAVALDQEFRQQMAFRNAWIALLLVIGLNGAVHNQHIEVYAWRWVADVAQNINEQIFLPNRYKRIDSLTILTPDQEQADFTRYVIAPQDNQPMLRALLSSKPIDLRIKPIDQATLKDQNPGPRALVFEMQENYKFRKLHTIAKESCTSFEESTAGLRETWIHNTNTSLQVNTDASYTSDGVRSIQVDVQSTGVADIHYGGVEIDWPQSSGAIFDFWIDQPQNLKSIYIYMMDQYGKPVQAWVNNKPAASLPANQRISLSFIPTQNTEPDFTWQSFESSEEIASLQIIMSVKEGDQVTFFIDQLCHIASKP